MSSILQYRKDYHNNQRYYFNYQDISHNDLDYSLDYSADYLTEHDIENLLNNVTFTTVKGNSFSFSEDDLLIFNEFSINGKLIRVKELNYYDNNGKLSCNGKNKWTFYPNPDFSGKTKIELVYTNGELCIKRNIDVYVKVEKQNKPPKAISKPEQRNQAKEELYTQEIKNYEFITQKNSKLVINCNELPESCYNIEGARLFSINPQVKVGKIINNNNNTWTYTAAENYTGEVLLYYELSDGMINIPRYSTIKIKDL